MVFASILTIGDELLIGQTIDTNSAFIAQELNKIGIWVKQRVAIGDVKEEILSAMESASKSSQVVIITGGLGPTADDITKPTLCEYFNSKLVLDNGALDNITEIFARFNRTVTERNRKQAEVPDNCIVLPNKRGTAPGMWFKKDDVIYVSLPGVPFEMIDLINDHVIPRLKEELTLPAIIHKTLLTSGVGESNLADELVDFEEGLPQHIKLAYLPSFGMIRLRLTGNSEDYDSLSTEIETIFNDLKGRVKNYLVADEDISIQEVVAKQLEEKHLFVSVAESCTGGYLSHLFTSRSGSSSIFKGGVVSYANRAKENSLGVQHATIVTNGAVSEETVIEMVKGVLQLMESDYAIATSGVMGPNGGTAEKPVGTVWIAVCNRNKVKTSKHFFRYDRKRNIELTAATALNHLRQFIIEEEMGKK